ncbi:glycosyltransferase involved in cell wall biosynthesis [Chitinivorax tropicus]|uniref:Glycosyltransferase involved in cell wall biosynthesis n=1 Tax=Chitinivorax tropicus TaxID=714531 RepID=A0A840MT57_9PROT|nr:glycosyltransferase family 4 protein [Chitinivorax tropicus]MBB5019576.1 glycosyltransferase involved in cell wall biosynthesis [Chitinivorax tropicus]
MRKVVVIGPHFSAQGGMATVLGVYREAGLFTSGEAVFLPTHIEGGKAGKLRQACSTFTTFVWMLVTRRVSMLHAHVATRASLWRKATFMLVATSFGVPYIFHLHSGLFAGFYQQGCGALGRRLIRFLLSRAAQVFVLSSEAERWVLEVVPQAKTVIFPNPIQLLPYIRADRDACHVLFMGKLDANKGIYDLLRAIAELIKRFPDLRLSVAGEGEREQVVALIRQLKLEAHVDLLGWVVGQQKSQLLASATVFVLPSYKEGMPMGILEAMSAGLPVVASRVGAVPDMLRCGTEGETVRAGDVVSLTQALDRLLSDTAHRESCAKRARLRVERDFAADVVLQRLKLGYYL